MKYSELHKEPNRRDDVIARINNIWKNLADFLDHAENRVLNYIFILNTGGLIATSSYLSSRSLTYLLGTSIVSFGIRVIFILIHATWGYYRAESLFAKNENDVISFYSDGLDWEEYLKRERTRGKGALVGHILGWLSGISFIVGMITGILSIWFQYN